jgi:hypothetical protein
MTRVLVTGVPRSGSSWLGEMLAYTQDTCTVGEPDNPVVGPFALRAVRRSPGGRCPVLRPGEEAPEYERLWLEAFGSQGAGLTRLERFRGALARRLVDPAAPEAITRAVTGSGRVPPALRAAAALAIPKRPPRPSANVIVKSVYGAFATEWIVERTGARPVLLMRDPRNVVSSWIVMGWLDGRDWEPVVALLGSRLQEHVRERLGAPPPPREHSVVKRLTWVLALMTLEFKDLARRHPTWQLVQHEELCIDPPARVHAVADNLGLTWTEAADAAIADANRPGEGYARQRVASELPTAWRSRLTSEQAGAIDAELARFG